MRRRRKEEAVFEEAGEFTHGLGEFGIDGVFGGGGGSGVVGFVEDEHRAAAVLLEPITEGFAVEFIAEEGVRDDEAGVRFPGVDAVAAFAAAADYVIAIEDDEGEAEADFHFGLPLRNYGGGAGDDDAFDLLTHDHFAEDEAGFDGFAEADVVGDKEVDAGQLEGLAEGFQLVGHDLDAGAVGGLEEAGVR